LAGNAPTVNMMDHLRLPNRAIFTFLVFDMVLSNVMKRCSGWGDMCQAENRRECETMPWLCMQSHGACGKKDSCCRRSSSTKSTGAQRQLMLWHLQKSSGQSRNARKQWQSLAGKSQVAGREAKCSVLGF